MGSTFLSLLALSELSYATFGPSCKCAPGDSCWPSIDTWNALNSSVSGKLILDTPPAISCYPGPYQNAEQCAYVNSQWYNSTFQSLSPVGYVYPTDDSCPPVDLSSGETPGKCTLGQAPVYTINATDPEELATGIAFAKKNNVRLVVRNTGHDILGKYVSVPAAPLRKRLTKQGRRDMELCKSGSSTFRRVSRTRKATKRRMGVARVTGLVLPLPSLEVTSGKTCMPKSSSAT